MNRLQISWIAMAAMLLAVSILTSCGHAHHHGPHQEGSSKEPDTKITNARAQNTRMMIVANTIRTHPTIRGISAAGWSATGTSCSPIPIAR